MNLLHEFTQYICAICIHKIYPYNIIHTIYLCNIIHTIYSHNNVIYSYDMFTQYINTIYLYNIFIQTMLGTLFPRVSTRFCLANPYIYTIICTMLFNIFVQCHSYNKFMQCYLCNIFM